MPTQDKYDRFKVLVLTVGCINYDHDINHFEPIRGLFKHTLRYDYFARQVELGRDGMNAELINLVNHQRPDYVFYITYQDQVELNTLVKIRNTGSKLIGWFSDDQWRFDQFSKKLARYLDYQITTDENAFDSYRELGFNPIHCQWGSNEHHYLRRPELEKIYDVSFVGSKHGRREVYLEQLESKGIRISGFGKDWNGRISFAEMINVFNRSKINLNFCFASTDEKIKQIKGRIFEVPMCGGFLLTDYVKGLENYFEVGREIETFRDMEEAHEKITYYLDHDQEREEIAAAGFNRARTEHTWEKRLKDVFDEILKDHDKRTSPKPGLGERMINRIFKV